MNTKITPNDDERLSAYLDGELNDEERRTVESRMATSTEWVHHLESMRRLGDFVRGTPEPLNEALAARIRARARDVAAVPARVIPWRRYVAAASIVLAITGAFFAGRVSVLRDSGPSATRPTREVADTAPVVESVPLHPVDPVDTELDGPEHIRAARAVLADVGVIDRVPEPLRSPILKAQLDHFELPRWANRVAREATPAQRPRTIAVADFFQRLDRSLTQKGGGAALLDYKQEALRNDFFRDALREPTHGTGSWTEAPWEARRHLVLRRVGVGMEPALLQSLDEILRMKEAWVRGEVGNAIRVTERTKDPRFAPLIGMSLATALGDAGLHELALPYLFPLQSTSPDAVAALLRTSFPDSEVGRQLFRTRPSGTSGKVKPPWLDAFSGMIIQGAGDGEIQVEEESGNGSWTYRIVIRTDKK